PKSRGAAEKGPPVQSAGCSQAAQILQFFRHLSSLPFFTARVCATRALWWKTSWDRAIKAAYRPPASPSFTSPDGARTPGRSPFLRDRLLLSPWRRSPEWDRRARCSETSRTLGQG